jgi:hypothetical protein
MQPTRLLLPEPNERSPYNSMEQRFFFATNGFLAGQEILRLL